MKNARLEISWFSPLPPQRGRVAECSMRMLSGLKPYMEIDVFVEDPSCHRDTPLADELSISSFTDFLGPDNYDLNVYHVANEPSCLFTCLSLLDFPGVMVLHELPQGHRGSEVLPELRADKRKPVPWIEGKRNGPLYSLPQRLIDSSLGIVVGNDRLEREVLNYHPRGPVAILDLETGDAKAFGDFLRLVLLGGFHLDKRENPARENLLAGLAGALSGAGIGLETPDLLEELSVVVDEIIEPRRD